MVVEFPAGTFQKPIATPTAKRLSAIQLRDADVNKRLVVHIVGVITGAIKFIACNRKLPAISAISIANPTQITFASAHGLEGGETIRILGSNSTPSLDFDTQGDLVATFVDATNITVPVNVTGSGSAGETVEDPESLSGTLVAGATTFLGLFDRRFVLPLNKSCYLEAPVSGGAFNGDVVYSFIKGDLG